MDTKKCTKCSETISSSAKKCKHCHSDLRSWFVRHKIITTILVLIIIGSFASKNDSSQKNDTDPIQENDNIQVTKVNCDQIKADMTTTEVKKILGEPSSISESEIAGLGKTEYLHFQEGFSSEACSVTTLNDKVTSKTWTNL